MEKRIDPITPADDDAKALARHLMRLKHGALAWTDPQTGTPGISRIALGLGPDQGLMTFVSSLAAHTPALMATPDCALMLGDPGEKGDPLTHPRLMLRARASFVLPDAPDRPALSAHWLAHHPKAKLYIDFADFAFVRFTVTEALLNAGFARAFRLLPADLG